MGSVSMTLPQAGLWILALLTATAFCQDTQKGSKARFDKILQQFGFSQQEKGGWQETEGRRNFVAEIAGPKVLPGPVSGRDLLQRLQEGTLEKTETDADERRLGYKKEILGQQKRLPKEDALAKLFSVAKDETHSYKLKSKKKKKKEKIKKVSHNLPKLKFPMKNTARDEVKNKGSKEEKVNRAGFSKERDADKVGAVRNGNVQNLALGSPVLGDKTKKVNQKPSVTRQTPKAKATNVKSLPYTRVSSQNGFAKTIVFIPPTEKPKDVINLKTNNNEKSPDLDKSRRKVGNKVKNDLKSGRIFIAPTVSSPTLEGFKKPEDEIFDNYISDVSSVRNLKERNPQDALANLFSVVKGKSGENPKRKKNLKGKRKKKVRSKNTSRSQQTKSQTPLSTPSLQKDPLSDLFAVISPASPSSRGQEASDKSSGNLRNEGPRPKPASQRISAQRTSPASRRLPSARPLKSSRPSSSPRVPTASQPSHSFRPTPRLSPSSRPPSPSPSSRLSPSSRPSSSARSSQSSRLSPSAQPSPTLRPSSSSPSSRPSPSLRPSSTLRPKPPSRSSPASQPSSSARSSQSSRLSPSSRPSPSSSPSPSARPSPST